MRPFNYKKNKIMKKLKFVKTFESFKINEEVPFNHDVFSSGIGDIRWTEKEKSDLERLGADEITKDDAVFKQRGFDVTIYKKISDGVVYYYATSNLSGSFGHYENDWDNQYTEHSWIVFLRRLAEFTKIGKVPMRSSRTSS
jgi:hypothetical protein